MTDETKKTVSQKQKSPEIIGTDASSQQQESIETIDTMTQSQKQDARVVATDNNVESSHPDDFYQQVLGSFQKKGYSSEEIKEKQLEWKKYEEPDKKVSFNDFPAYFYSGFWIRFFAFLIDICCIQAVTTATLGLFYRLNDLTPVSGGFSVYAGFSLVIYLGYFALLTKLNQGQTIGKMIFGIRVISFSEAELSWKTVLIREVCMRYVLQFHFIFLLGYLPAIFSSKKQHIGDYFADTSVITINLIKAFNKEAQA